MTGKAKKLPDSSNYIPMIVSALKEMSGVAKAAAVKDWIADSLIAQGKAIPEAVLASGGSKFANDIQWARMYLVNAGLIEPMEKAGYGNWKLTPSGWVTSLGSDEIEKMYEKTMGKAEPQEAESIDAPTEDQLQPETEVQHSWETVLKSLLTKMPDKGFERLCAYLMTSNGLIATKVTGQTADGGIDGEGMLAFDDLALIKTPVAWQCKRFEANKVPSKAVRDFRGAIEGRAKYGLIFTTSSFTEEAKKEAQRPGAIPIELVGLDRLVLLMRDRRIGLREISTYEVIQEFFDEYLHPAG